MPNVQYTSDYKTAFFNNAKYTRDDKTGYYLKTTGKGSRRRLHRDVYEFCYGEIEKGLHIHHKDGDKTNNSKENLVAVCGSDHARLHAYMMTEAQREKKRRHMIETVSPKADVWRHSEMLREQCRRNYENNKERLHEKVKCVCSVCGKEYMTIKKAGKRFCSGKCRAQNRRNECKDMIPGRCLWCGKEFLTNKYKKASCCSVSCSNRARASVKT